MPPSLRTREGALDTDGPLDLVAAKAAGYLVVALYLDGNLNPRVARQATDLGMGLVSLWEGFASNPDGGAAQGNDDGVAATDLALAIGQPRDTVIYVPNDQVVNDWAATLDYFHAAAARIRGRGYVPGFYGQTSVHELLPDYPYFFKGSDGTNDTTGANIVQGTSPQAVIAGALCDVDTVLTPTDFGGWNYDGPWPKIAPPPTPDPPATKEPPVLYLIEVSDPQFGSGVFRGMDWVTLCGGKLSPVAATDLGTLNKSTSVAKLEGPVSWNSLAAYAS